MRTLLATILVSILAAAFGCGVGNTPPRAEHPPDPPAAPTTQPAVGEVMAVVNGRKIMMDQLHTILVDGHGLAIARHILLTEIVKQTAASKGITVNDKEIDEENERYLNLTFPMANNDTVRRQMLDQLLLSRKYTYSTWRLIMHRNTLLRKMIGTDFDVPEEAVRGAFNKRYEQMVVVSHIETKSHVAAKLVKSLTATRDFAALAKEYSVNPTGRNGGRLPPIGHNTRQVSPALRQVAMAMTKIGEISDPVQVASRFHILKLEKIIASKKVRYADEKDKIAAELKEKHIRSTGVRLLRKLSEAADVEYVNPSLKTQIQQRAGKKP